MNELFASVFTELFTGCCSCSSAMLSLSDSDLELLSESLELGHSPTLECAASNDLYTVRHTQKNSGILWDDGGWLLIKRLTLWPQVQNGLEWVKLFSASWRWETFLAAHVMTVSGFWVTYGEELWWVCWDESAGDAFNFSERKLEKKQILAKTKGYILCQTIKEYYLLHLMGATYTLT